MDQKKEKFKNNFFPEHRQKGAAMLISTLFFIFISLAIIAGLVAPSVREFKNIEVNLNSKSSYFLAESGVEDAAYRIIRNKTLAGSETITINYNSAVTTVTSLPGNNKQIVSLADVSTYQRKVKLTVKTGNGAVFKYGTQSGQGGFVFHNNSFVTGSLYSNGNIVGSNGAYVTGDAFVAGATGSISNISIGYGGTGDAHAHTITASTATGNFYCQTGSRNNKSFDTSQADPISQYLPIASSPI